MGKKSGNWFSSVRKALRPSSSSIPSKDRNKHNEREPNAEERANEAAEIVSVEHFPAETSPEVTIDGGTIAGDNEEEVEQKVMMQAAAEAALAAAESTARKIRIKAYQHAMMVSSREDRAAVRIQAFYRGYLARRALRALKGLVRLQALVRGHHVRKQVHTTMRSMQALIRAQARVHAHRLFQIQNSQQNQLFDVKQRVQVPQHGNCYFQDFGMRERERKGDIMERIYEEENWKSNNVYGDWDTRNQSIENLKANAQRRHDAVVRRERALAYAYNCQMQQQWHPENDKQQFGWNWLESWMARQPHLQSSTIDPMPTSISKNNISSHNNYNNNSDQLSEKTVEMDTIHSSTNHRPRTVPGYMAATWSARAKVRDELPIPRFRERRRSAFGCDTSSSGGRLSPKSIGLRPVQTNDLYSPESSYAGDDVITPPSFGRRNKTAVYV
ncbi:hypothetical protein LUZ60_012673 [Juncus effusus]|nr:hypothetical protein LUZ60_012673 [Juncus effusus]